MTYAMHFSRRFFATPMYTLTVFFSSSVTDRTDRTMVLARRGETVADSTYAWICQRPFLFPSSSCPQACQRGFPSLVERCVDSTRA